MATIKDVARRAGVAISTVSAVINRSAPVSEQVVGKVQSAIAEIGYVPHGAAQLLRSGQSKLVGLIVPNIANPHFSDVARIIENACLSAGYMSMVYSTGQDPQRETQILRMLRLQRVAGIVIIPTRSDCEHGERLREQIHVPTVLLDMYVEGLDFEVVKLDNVKASRIATDYLLDLGHRRIGVLTGISGLATSEDRLEGYDEAFRQRGLTPDERLKLRGDFQQQQAFESTLMAMNSKEPPTAILSFNNFMTLGALAAMRHANLSVPKDVSLIGIDDFDFAELMDPPPTVVRVPVPEMAARAIELLFEAIGTKTPPNGRWEVFEPTLVTRASCRSIGSDTRP